MTSLAASLLFFRVGNSYSQQWIREVIRWYGSQIGRDVHPHMFRHGVAIHMVKHGCDVERLKRLLGHASIQTSVVYLRFQDTDLDEIYDQVSF